MLPTLLPKLLASHYLSAQNHFVPHCEKLQTQC